MKLAHHVGVRVTKMTKLVVGGKALEMNIGTEMDMGHEEIQMIMVVGTETRIGRPREAERGTGHGITGDLNMVMMNESEIEKGTETGIDIRMAQATEIARLVVLRHLPAARVPIQLDLLHARALAQGHLPLLTKLSPTSRRPVSWLRLLIL
jgi:hypothetical protein